MFDGYSFTPFSTVFANVHSNYNNLRTCTATFSKCRNIQARSQ